MNLHSVTYVNNGYNHSFQNALHKKVEEFTRTYTANEDLKMKLTELEEKKKEKERSLVKCESEIESLTEDNQALKEKNTKLTIESNACGERNDVLVQRNNKLEVSAYMCVRMYSVSIANLKDSGNFANP